MNIRVVSWTGGVVALDGMTVIDSSSAEAARAVKAALAEPVKVWQEGDRVKEYAPGEPGFIREALRRLDDAVVTGGDDNG